MNTSGCFCRINKKGVILGDTEYMRFTDTDTAENLLALYRHTEIDYPKFHKMDLLSKASFLGIELLKERCPELARRDDDTIGLFFANSESSSHTDMKFRDSYEVEGMPGPSLFVYTLPNIAMGEIAIRNKWYGAHIFAVFPNFAPTRLVEYGSLMAADGSDRVILGWVNVRDGLDVLFFAADREFFSERDASAKLAEAYANQMS